MRACGAGMQITCTEGRVFCNSVWRAGRTDRQVTVTPHLHSVLTKW